MNFTAQMWREMIPESDLLTMNRALAILSGLDIFWFYAGIILSIVNLSICILCLYMYRQRVFKKACLLFVANLSISDILMPLLMTSARFFSEFSFIVSKSNKILGLEITEDETHSARESNCKLWQSTASAFGYNYLLSLALLTLDRCISIEFPLQYQNIMTTKKVFFLIAVSWIVSISLGGVANYFTISLRKNHICSYSFVVSRELSILLLLVFFFTISVLAVTYINMLRKFYAHKRKLETLESKLIRDLKGTGTHLYVIPLSIEKTVPSPVEDNIKLSSIKYCSESKERIVATFSHRPVRNVSLSQSVLAFCTKYIKSSKYVQVIMIAWSVFHFPYLILCIVEEARLGQGYYNYRALETCGAGVDSSYSWSREEEFYLGDCIGLMTEKSCYINLDCSCIIPDIHTAADTNSKLNISTSYSYSSSAEDISDSREGAANNRLNNNKNNNTAVNFCLSLNQGLSEYLAKTLFALLYRIAVLNSAVNPLLYAIWYPPFRRGVIAIYRRRIRQQF